MFTVMYIILYVLFRSAEKGERAVSISVVMI